MTITPLDWQPGTWLIAALMLALLVLPVWLITRQRGVSTGRKNGRVALHGLLWLALLGLWLQPRWQQKLPTGTLLLAADNVPAGYVRSAAASLGIRTTLTVKAFRALKTNLPVDTVRLLGQDFPGNVLARLSRQVVIQDAYDVPGQLQHLRWKGIVRLGERQTVSGQIYTDESSTLRLRFGQKTVDSTRVEAGRQVFRLTYPVFSQGRTSLTLWRDETLVDTLRFFSQSTPALRVRFVLDAPDFETRTLADWLGQQGNAVALTNRLSTGISSELSLNKTAPDALPDLVIADPSTVGNPLVGRALAAGKSLLVLNLTRPELDVAVIGRATGTGFRVRRLPGKDTVRLAPNLTALPFRFGPSPGTLVVAGYPVALQSGSGRSAGNRVAISLLAETFPLRLSGDSVAYARLWQSVLAQLRPAGQNTVAVDAPVFQHQLADFAVNNADAPPRSLRVGADTLPLRPLPANARSYAATGRFGQSGWLAVADTAAVYVYSDLPAPGQRLNNGLAAVARRNQTAAWVRAHRRFDLPAGQTRKIAVRTNEKTIPDWGWLLAIGLLLSALWVETKLT